MEPEEPLPSFRYHPDPLATGVVRAAPDTPCLGCNRLRGYVYTGPAHTAKNFMLSHCVCPWCIADGTLARQFGAGFNDAGTLADVPDAVRLEIEQRTPGFERWQDGDWPSCCGDAAAFLGAAGAAELGADLSPAATAVREVLREDYELSASDLEEFFDALDKEGMPTAYVFRCLHCGAYHAEVDQT